MKKIMRLFCLSVILMFGWKFSEAQSFAESALLFSRTLPAGSARIQSLGGAQVSLGGDYSSAASNPAGLGMYNRSEFAITPGINTLTNSADYLNTSSNGSRSVFQIPGIAMAFHTDYTKETGFLGGTFSVAYSRLNDFNRTINYGAFNPNSSIIDYFLEQASGSTNDQFDSDGALFDTPTGLAYYNYLIGDSTVIDASADPTAYFTDVLGAPTQVESIKTRGAQNQWSFSYGTNYSDKLFLGIGIGLTSIRYKSYKVYGETFQNEPLLDLTLQENLEIKGSGVNATFGAIYRPLDIVQIGFSATTPTHYEITDTYYATMTTNWDNFQYDPSTTLTHVEESTDIVSSNYTLNTPWKMSLGATVFVSKNGFITADVEKINYSKAKYSSNIDDISFTEDNNDIKSLYQSVYNFRIGAEYRVKKFRFRGGYSYMPDPFQTTQNNVARIFQSATAGAGYRTKNFYVDLAVMQSSGKNTYTPYTLFTGPSPVVTNSQKNTNIMLTVGFPF